MRLSFLFICILLILSACTNKPRQNRSFCYWKTGLGFDAKETQMIKRLGVSHLYVRFFDVDWNPYEKEALPVATVNGGHFNFPGKLSITPAIFITNDVIRNSDKVALDSLAARILRKTKLSIGYLIKNGTSNKAEVYCDSLKLDYERRQDTRDSVMPIFEKQIREGFTEILIDCDWSAQTRESYFYLLNKLKDGFKPYQLSATIRLWQYKYREKAGIPPVDRGLLMCYNMENTRDHNVNNSISSLEEMQKYIKGPEYPVNLDIALPVFSWGVVFREGKFKGLLSKPDIRQYLTDTNNFRQSKPNHFILLKDQLIGNNYFRYGDEIRIEQLSLPELEKITNYIREDLHPGPDSRITFFSWDTTYLKNYGIENLNSLYKVLGH